MTAEASSRDLHAPPKESTAASSHLLKPAIQHAQHMVCITPSQLSPVQRIKSGGV